MEWTNAFLLHCHCLLMNVLSHLAYSESVSCLANAGKVSAAKLTDGMRKKNFISNFGLLFNFYSTVY